MSDNYNRARCFGTADAYVAALEADAKRGRYIMKRMEDAKRPAPFGRTEYGMDLSVVKGMSLAKAVDNLISHQEGAELRKAIAAEGKNDA